MTAPEAADAGGFALFDTAIGRCGIAWHARGILGLQLPEASDRRTAARLQRRHPGLREALPTAEVRRAITAVAALLRGERVDLAAVALDMNDLPPFHRRVYEAARAIPPGQTLTYGAIAARLGEPAAAREVGEALGANPFPLVVPCHRVVAADGRFGGFSAHGGVATKRRLLWIEGAAAAGTADLFDQPAG